MGIKEVNTAPPSPWQNPFVERLIGTLRRDRLDQVVVPGENHLRQHPRLYLAFYHTSRPYLSLDKDAPKSRSIEPPETRWLFESRNLWKLFFGIRSAESGNPSR